MPQIFEVPNIHRARPNVRENSLGYVGPPTRDPTEGLVPSGTSFEDVGMSELYLESVAKL